MPGKVTIAAAAYERRKRYERIAEQAVRLERLLGLGPETIGTYGDQGVILTPDQAAALLAIVDTGTCECRCMEGRDCGGCGHPGCGYTRPTP